MVLYCAENNLKGLKDAIAPCFKFSVQNLGWMLNMVAITCSELFFFFYSRIHCLEFAALIVLES